MLLGQGHRSVEANNREFAGHVQDGLDNRFAHFWVQVIKLGRVVPGHGSTVIAMIDEFLVTGPEIYAFENHRGICAVVIVVIQVNPHALIPRKVCPIERIGRKWAVIKCDKPIWMFDDPGRIDAHMVRYHVRCQANAAFPGPIAQVAVGLISPKITGDIVIEKGISRGNCILVASQLFNLFGRRTAFPQANQPQSRESPTCEGI